MKSFSKLFAPDVLKCLGADASVNSRASEGGTSGRRVKAQLKRVKKALLEKAKP